MFNHSFVQWVRVGEPSYIEIVCVLEKKQFNVKPTKKAQRQAQSDLVK